LAVAVDDAAAREHARTVTQASGTSFFWAMRLLPAVKRDAMFAVYAFCREVDDVADDPGDPADKLNRLRVWREEIERLFHGEPREPVTCALAAPVDAFGLRKETFMAVIEGMEQDAAGSLRIADMAALEAYCDRVACAVGRLSNRVFGVDEAAGEPVAVALGQALQLTNILRDLREDAALDRLYLPGDLLRAHGIPEGTAAEVLRHPALPAVCDEIARHTRRRYAEAEAALAACDRRTMRPAIMMMQVYRRIFEKLCRRGWRRLDRPVLRHLVTGAAVPISSLVRRPGAERVRGGTFFVIFR
jgi:squalene synthase HpnD